MKDEGSAMRAMLTTLAVLAAAAAQTQAPAQPPTFKSNTNVVQVDVRVFKGKQFVTGLGADDFVVTEDGVPQKIEFAVLIGPPAPSAPLAPSAQTPSAPLAPLAPLAPSAPSVWLFVFDTPHLSPAGLTHTRDAVLQFIDTKWHQGDIGGIVYDGRMANNRLTSDAAELRADVAAVKMPGNQQSLQIQMTREWPRFQDEYEVMRVGIDNDPQTVKSVVLRACDEDRDACRRADPAPEILGKARELVAEIQQSTTATLASVVALANGLARLAGPKTVVFLSEGFVADKMETQIRDAIGDAARAGAHFYTIDARGLNRGSASSSIIDQPIVGSVLGRTARFDTASDGPNSLAVDTGGFAIRNENNFGRALDEIQRDAGEYYVIGYNPTNATFDGKYRAINVGVKEPALKVRARRGYLALAPALLLKPVAATNGANSANGAKGAKGAGAVGASGANGAAAGIGVPDLPEMPLDMTIGALPSRVPTAGSNAAVADAVRARVESGVLTLKTFDAKDVAAGYAERGWTEYEKGNLEAAAKELSNAAATDTRPWVSYALGYAEYGLRRLSDAVDAWTRVKKSVPEFEPVYFNLADAMSLMGDESGAIKALRDAEKRWPKDAEIADAIGVIDVRRTALDEAIKSFHLATALAPADPVGFFNLGRAYQMRFNQSQRYDAAMEKWVGRDDDRSHAIAAYTKYIAMHGPYEQQAKEAIATLQWKK
jgi:VWFA-related protein